MPDAFELPRVLGAVVPHMSGEGFAGCCGSVVHELVAFAFGRPRLLNVFFARRCSWLDPGLAAIVGALNNLPKPAACLQGVNAIRIGWWPLQRIHLPPPKLHPPHVHLATP